MAKRYKVEDEDLPVLFGVSAIVTLIIQALFWGGLYLIFQWIMANGEHYYF